MDKRKMSYKTRQMSCLKYYKNEKGHYYIFSFLMINYDLYFFQCSYISFSNIAHPLSILLNNLARAKNNAFDISLQSSKMV